METDEGRERVKRSKTGAFFLSPLTGLYRLLGKILGDDRSATEDAILEMVDAASVSGVIENTGREIIRGAFEFDDKKVSDVMVHRINIVGVSEDAELNDIIYTALDEGYSRLPVYGENLDNIKGIIVVKDLLSLIGKPDLSNFVMDAFIREAVFVPESISCTKVFLTLKEKKAAMAIVIDEYGGTAGIITIEDLVEEIMGSIPDEYNEEKVLIEKKAGGKYVIDGEADPDEVLELFGYRLPFNHEYETLAGFVTDLLGFIPDEGQKPQVDYKDLRFVVTEMEDNCINKVIAFRKTTVA